MFVNCYGCPKCGKVFATTDAYITHDHRDHKPPPEKSYKERTVDELWAIRTELKNLTERLSAVTGDIDDNFRPYDSVL